MLSNPPPASVELCRRSFPAAVSSSGNAPRIACTNGCGRKTACSAAQNRILADAAPPQFSVGKTARFTGIRRERRSATVKHHAERIHISLAVVIGSPRICSGWRYSGRHRPAQALVSPPSPAVGSRIFAIPKSSTWERLPLVTRTLLGLMSRWMTNTLVCILHRRAHLPEELEPAEVMESLCWSQYRSMRSPFDQLHDEVGNPIFGRASRRAGGRCWDDRESPESCALGAEPLQYKSRVEAAAHQF